MIERRLLAAAWIVVVLAAFVVASAAVGGQRIARVDSPARVCWADPDTGRSFGQCWRVRVLEDGSGCVRVSRRAAALDGRDRRTFCGPGR